MILTKPMGRKEPSGARTDPLFASYHLSGTRTPFSVGRETAPGTHA
jgi:hypothetical protein